MEKVWLITGASGGLCGAWMRAALERGDKVAALDLHPERLDDLKAHYEGALYRLQVDVTNRGSVFDAVERAHQAFGRIDVVVNGAGFGLFGMVEEVSEAQARAQIEVNFFGTLWVTQAVLPIMRAQGHGHIMQVSSIGGVNAFPSLGLYNASKWAVEGMSQALAGEVAPLGVHVTLVEPAGYQTEWRLSAAVRTVPMPVYDPLRADMENSRSVGPGLGDPDASGPAILALADAAEPPLRFFLGKGPLEVMTAEYEKRLAGWRAWNDLSAGAHSKEA
jgi:NAD(P)-dependent dehydrogenase (short-subunit alcohol dehydrogenase family)